VAVDFHESAEEEALSKKVMPSDKQSLKVRKNLRPARRGKRSRRKGGLQIVSGFAREFGRGKKALHPGLLKTSFPTPSVRCNLQKRYLFRNGIIRQS